MSYIIHWFPFCSGGLCDRILGIAGNLCIAKLLNRKLLLRWDNTPLTPIISVNSKYNYYTYQIPFEFVNLNNFESMDYFKTVDIITEWKNKNIMIWSNINLYYYLSINPFFKHIITDNYIHDFSEAIKYVLNNILNIDNTIFDNYKIYDIGIHISTGDKQIYNKENEEFYREYITNIFEKIKDHSEFSEQKTLFISSDCLLAFEIAKNYFKNFEYNQGVIVHTAQENKITNEGIYKVALDLITLCNIKETLFIGWNSNFSRIAALYNENRKFICYEYYNNSNVINEISNDTLFSYHSNGKYT